ncbi:MAG: hypothetical protein PHS57_08840 [Alphaproteobacteria bacterium]|nr:hypothetical protein [Alphaproteobacteria bacterium]
MGNLRADIHAIQNALNQHEAKTESGLSESEESRIIRGHNRAATLIQVAAVIGGAIAAYFGGFGFLLFGFFVAWLFHQARLK